MATLTAEKSIGGAAFNAFQILSEPGLIVDVNQPEEFKVHLGNVGLDFFSSAGDFTYVGSNPRGTISSVDILTNNELAQTIADLKAAIDALRPGGAVADLFQGDDTITGSKFDDTIAGFGGRDTLKGGKGRDLFLFDTKLGADNVDTIKDFSHKHDVIGIDHALVGADAGTVKSKYFHAGSKAADKNDQLIYNDHTGKLYLDPDGKGHEDQILVAILKHHPTIDVHDFLLV